MKLTKIIQGSILLFSAYILVSCNKKDFLDKKPNTNLVVPTTLEDFQRLMDADGMNVTGILGEISTDDYYIRDYASWQAITLNWQRNAYIWAQDIYEGAQYAIDDWNYPYQQVLYANTILNGLPKVIVTADNNDEWNRTKGWALFLRGYAFFNLAQHFAPQYDEATASGDLGIPLRLEPDVTITSVRASVKQTYEQVLSDLLQATELLPDRLPGADRNRPYKSAALALLARVYLSMRNYPKALEYASETLKKYNKLIDYNTLSTTSVTPFSRLNDETLYQSVFSFGISPIIGTGYTAPNSIVDSVLYALYENNDLRKILFFRTWPTHDKLVYKWNYNGTTGAFSGLATDETYLIKAECLVRTGSYTAGINTLNELLVNRYQTGTFTPLSASNETEALNIILKERRKELPLRGLRWQDLRRLNKEGANITLTRVLNGQTYTLLPNDKKYVLPIPPDEIRLSGMQQNPR